MKPSFLLRLQHVAWRSLIGALLLFPLVPLLQIAILEPQGYSTALLTPQTSLDWISGHLVLFLLYRLSLLLGFVLLLGLPFALFRIIVAQEIVARAEMDADANTDADSNESDENSDEDKNRHVEAGKEENGMPSYAWRGKGFAVIAAWTGLLGLFLTIGGLLGSTIYLWTSASTISAQKPVPDTFIAVSHLFAIIAYAFGGGLLTLACLFFGIVIARSGRKLWPDSWVAFGYAALAIGAITSGSAAQIALSAAGEQTPLTTLSIFLFALWSCWFSIMVVRLRSE